MPKFELSTKQIAREALPRLMDNLVMPNLVYKEHIDGSASAKQGDIVSVRCPVFLQAEEFDEAEGVTPQYMQKNTIDIRLDHLATVDMQVDAIEAACDFDSIVKLFIEPAAVALAEKINAEGLMLYKDIPFAVNNIGQPITLKTLADASAALNMNRAPGERRNAVYNPQAIADMQTIPSRINAEKVGTTSALRNGEIGKVFGVSTYMSQAVCRHEPSYTGTITLAAEAVYADAIRVQASAAGTLKAGDMLKIGDQTVTVTRDVVLSASSAVNVRISPFANAAANTPVELLGAHNANLVFHPDAFVFITRPLATPAGVDSYVTTYNGLSLRVTRGYDMKYKRDMLSMDVLYAFRTVYPELAVRVMT